MTRKWTLGLLLGALALAAMIVPVAFGGLTGKQAKTIKFGLIIPEKAPYFDDTQSLGAAKAALRAINARGGFNGAKGVLVYCNEKNDANVASACARQMVQQKVAAVVGGVMLSGAPVNAILQAAKIPQIGIYPTTAAEYNAPNVFLLGGQGAYDWQVTTAYAANQGARISFVANDNAASTGNKPVLQGVAVKASNGTGFVNSVTVPTAVADFSPLVASAEKGGATAALVYLDPGGNGKQFMLAAEAANAPFKYYIRVGSDMSLAQAMGSAAAKMIDASPFPIGGGKPLLQRFYKELAIEKKSGDAFADASLTRTSSLGTWLGYYVVEKLVKTGKVKGNVTAASLMKAMNSAKNINMGGVIPPWTPTAPGPTGFSRVSNPYMYITSYTTSGQPKLLAPKPVTVAQAIAGKY